MNRLPELSHDFPGVSDPVALQAEIDSLRDQLSSTTGQLALERELAMDVHRARARAVSGSSALELVFGVGDGDITKSQSGISADVLLSSAFARKITSPDLAEGFTATAAKALRISTHPDRGGNTKISQDVAHSLARLDEDPTFSIAKALLAAPKSTEVNSRTQRTERYRLHLALAGAKPQFESVEAARKNAEVEINGAEWRVRTQAAFRSLELIVGGDDVWNRFIQDIVQTQRISLIHMVNRVQPLILSLQERLAKGDPIAAIDALDITAIDAIFERIWSTIGNRKESRLPYNPPYHNWLEILLPAMELLDPGEKAGEEYTHFEPPIQVTYAPAPYRDYGGGYGQTLDERFVGQNLNSEPQQSHFRY